MKYNHANNHAVWESLFVLMLYALFAMLAFTMVAVGAGVYSDIRDTGNNNYDIRTSLSFAATQVRQTDFLDGVRVIPYEEGNALVMEEMIDGERYETWLYHYDGALYQLFVVKGIVFTPASGERVLDIEKFEISQLGQNAIVFRAENKAGKKGEMVVALRTTIEGGDFHVRE